MIIHHIPAKQSGRKQRVAAYCRVSSSCASQEESFATQKKYYELYIGSNPDWDAAGIYSDEGITGTSVQKRPGFRQMIADAQSGKLDIILVKSISRFSRNAVECQRYVCLLKEHRVQVIFEEEGIDSMNPASDLIFNIRTAFAQEESRIISENVRWTYRKNFENGVYHRGNNRVLGYDEIDGELVPNACAETVRLIFHMFADGVSLLEICRELRNQGVKRLRSEKDYDSVTLARMLHNELYVGDLRTGKSVSNSFFSSQDKHTQGPSGYWYDHHSAIIDREVWNKVQSRLDAMEEMKTLGIPKVYGNHHMFYGKLYCGECGAFYKRRTLTSKNGALYKAWNCTERQKGKSGNGCKCRTVKEEALKAEIVAFLKWESFDEKCFSKQVKKVWVRRAGIHIETNKVFLETIG